MIIKLTIKAIFLIGFSLWGFKVNAQEVGLWSLKQCIDHAIANNIQIKQSKLNVNVAEYNLTQSKASLLPSINARASHSFNFGRRVDPFTNDFVSERVLSNSFSLTGNITIYSGLLNYHTIKKKEQDLFVSQYDSDKSVNDISFSIAGNYLQVLFNMEMEEISRRQVEVSKGQIKRTQKLVNAGSLPKGDLLEIESQHSLDKLQHLESQNNLDLSYLTLKQLLDIEPSQLFEIAVPEIEIDQNTSVLSTSGQVYDAAIAVMPQIKSSGHQLKSAERSLAIAKGRMSPTLTFGGTYGTGYSDARNTILEQTTTYVPLGYTSTGEDVLMPLTSYVSETTPFKDQISDNVNKNIGFNLSIPVFNGLQTRTAVNKAIISLKNAEYNLQLEKNQLKEDIQRSYMEAGAALEKYYAYKKSLVSFEKAFQYVKKKFDVGILTAIEFNDSKNKLNKAESEALQAKYDFVYKTKILEFYQGNSLAF